MICVSNSFPAQKTTLDQNSFLNYLKFQISFIPDLEKFFYFFLGTFRRHFLKKCIQKMPFLGAVGVSILGLKNVSQRHILMHFDAYFFYSVQQYRNSAVYICV